MLDVSEEASAAVGPAAGRVYETSAGVIHAMFAPTSVVLARVAADGWMPVFGRGPAVPRSAPALSAALRTLDVADEEAERLADRLLVDWQAIESPVPRSRRQDLADVLRFAALALRLLARVPQFAWEVLRERESKDRDGEDQPWLVRPGSPEYGVIRLLKTSVGWVELEFWGGPEARLGVYRDDGWLPLSRQRFHLDQFDLVRALRSDGLPDDEAERVASLVLAEREARVAGGH
jgi:hypothetical protein